MTGDSSSHNSNEPPLESKSTLPDANNSNPSLEEYHLLKAVNEALFYLLEQEDKEVALRNACEIVGEAIQCEGIVFFKFGDIIEEKALLHSEFCLAKTEDRWERWTDFTLELPLEDERTRTNYFRVRDEGYVSITSRTQNGPNLTQILEQLGVGSYFSCRITIGGQVWGVGTFVSRSTSLNWVNNNIKILIPFLQSVGSFLASHEAQKELKAQQDYFKQIIDVCPNPIFVKNRQGVLTMVNQAMSKPLRLKPSEIIGQSIKALLPSEQEAVEILKEDAEIFSSGKPKIDLLKEITTINGKCFLQISKIPLVNSKGEMAEIVSVLTDLTDLKNTEKQLRAEKHFSESINNTIPDWVFLVDLNNHCFNYQNIKYPILGYDASEIADLFKFMVSRLHPEDKPFMNDFIEKLTHSAPAEIVEKRFRLQHKEGHWVHFFERARVMNRFPDGTIKEYLAVIQDISTQVAFQQQIERSELRYRNFINYSQEGIYYMNCKLPISIHLPFDEMTRLFYENAYIEECNATFARMYGSSIENIVGMKAIHFHSGEHFEENIQSFKDLVKNGFQVSNIETIEPDMEGKFKHFLNNAVGIIENEHLIGFWGTQIDITEKKDAEQTLIKNKQLLKAIVNALPDLKFRVNKSGVFLDYYESEYENEPPLVPPVMFIGKTLEEVLPSFIAEVGMRSIELAIEKKRVQSFEYYLPTADDLYYYEGRVSPISEEEVIVGVRNISDRKKAQLALQDKLQELDEKNKQLTQYIESNFQLENFAYIASHDLREPVRTVHSFAQLLKKRYYHSLDEDGQKCLEFIIYGSENMNRLIDDLLTYSRVSSEEHQVAEVRVSILMEEVKSSIAQVMKEKDALVFLNDLPAIIEANPTTIKQLFQNLLVNAIKFHHPQRQPIIYISGIEQGDHWLFEVKDNGMGIPEDMKEKIFQLFKKFHYVKAHQGTGIGLAICKRIVEQHGGEIWVESSTEIGSSFYFTITKQQNTNRAIPHSILS